MHTILWNSQTKLIISDVDETIADNYAPAEPKMIQELTRLLENDIALFLVSGAGLNRIQTRITDFIPQSLRKHILIAHCSGAEIWGFAENGELKNKPFYSMYEGVFSDEQKVQWRDIVKQLINEFKLTTYDPMTELEFKQKTNNDPHSVILEDRGPQITFECINNPELRIPLVKRAEELLTQAVLPVTPRLGGMWALDLAVQGANKTAAVMFALSDSATLPSIGLDLAIIADPTRIEIWGDRFAKNQGTDWLICEALSKSVRAIDFRKENPTDFPNEYNIVVWDGEKQLQHGLLEYLQSFSL